MTPAGQRQSNAGALAAARLQQFRDLQARGALCTSVTEELAIEAAERFLGELHSTGEYLDDAVALLAEISTLEEPCLSDPGQRATFPLLIERLSDSFDPALCPIYDRVFAQIVSHLRTLPVGARVDATLSRFGIRTEKDLLERRRRIANRLFRQEPAQSNRIRKVLTLSRVTLGADVALTSVILQKTALLFPRAERVLLAPGKARELFGGDRSLRIEEVPYASGGSLVGRLESWLSIVDKLADEIRGLSAGEYLLIDPDSRYLQLGMLPVLPDESRYVLFESRSAGASRMEPLSRLIAEWLDGNFESVEGAPERVEPKVWLRKQDEDLGRRVVAQLNGSKTRRVIALSFGVGGNQDKRLADPFEECLLTRMLQEGYPVVLDQGVGEEERERARRLAEAARHSGYSIAEWDAATASCSSRDARLITWQGAIGVWSGIIAASNCFVGYDSSGQHIAAALGTPTIDIFSSTTTVLFRERWKPRGPGIVRIVTEDVTRGAGSAADMAEMVVRTVKAITQK